MSSDDGLPQGVDFGYATVASCLEEAGATFARSADELGFLWEAERKHRLSGLGFTHDDRAARVVVNVWSEQNAAGRPPGWTVWIAQPFLQQRNPREIVEIDPDRSYVAYVLHPSPARRRMVEACVDTDA